MYVDHYSLPLHLLWFQLPLLKLILMEHLIVLNITSQLLQVYNPHTDIVVLYYLKEFSLVPRPHPAFHHLQLGEPGNKARKYLFWYLSDSK